MKNRNMILSAAGLALAACATSAMAQPAPAPAYTPPVDAAAQAGQQPLPGAVPGTTAADRDGDGIIDGYYSADGYYHPVIAPPPPRPASAVSRHGERG